MACVLAVLPLLAQAGSVVTGEIRGAIGPAGTAYLERVLSHAATVRAELVVIALDTPGGLDTSMREMIQAIIGSPVPVAIFVSPRGARAASAGTYLLYAAHVAAMAPGTNVGAATPIALGIGGDHAPRPEDRADGAAGGKDAGEADERAGTPRDPAKAKAMRDAAAYLQSLADMRGRSTEWARKAVVEADSLPAREALRTGVIDVVASDLPDLLRQIDGRGVEVVGTVRKLDVAGASIDSVAPNWKERFLATISNPNIALLLMMAAIYGLLIEFYVPGTAVPGVIGGISLLLGLYGLALLPVNLAGAALVVLGLMLMVAEAFAPSFGALGLGGAVAFAAGALFLLDDVPGFAVSWGLVVPVALANALVIAAVAAYAVKARKRPGVTGIEGMIGTYAEALEDFERDGWVRAHGERWRARSTGPLRRGERARITGIAGLVVAVEPSNEEGA